MDKNTVLVSGGVLFQKDKNKKDERWLVVKHGEESEWEIPKVIVRKVESSVRAIIRTLGEQGGMTVQVLEEAGRAGGVATINGRTLPQRYIYYLVMLRSTEGELVGFEEAEWLTYANAVRRLPTKRERQMLKAAREELRAWEKRRKKRKEEEESDELEEGEE